MFKRALKFVESVMGNGETDSDELEKVGKFLFEDKWVGVFASDEVDPTLQGEGYYLCNLDNHNEDGSHWTALAVRGCVIYYFDSFARTQRTTLRLEDPHHVIVQEINPNIVQGARESNCGQRCLAWLMVFDTSPEDALSI